LAFIEIETIKNLYARLDYRDLKQIIELQSTQNKEIYRYTKVTKLPSLITNADDIYSFHLPEEDANFITLKTTISETITENELGKKSPKGKIVFIKSADPGYDFLFSKNISGLVTQFGGANSHMAVRCAELGIPAIIGVGEKNFCLWEKSKIIKIDCLNHQVQVIQ
jgi:glutamine kinase